ncbi:hypothetical protein HB779_13410 [Phyllobacterium sp. 628]|uniref:hypothetical protein n=1 Tax=Phyllobacterium sp. 628 TaxID=2718938 RepID=UPI001662308F|nr:hypothetical protein [Phyllobacterium sp. 628]QND52791.1 hypothetical protein HB779_13410 [Phyllobacterium sp. 628]
MACSDDMFEVLTATYGNGLGFKAIHVSLKEWVRPPGFSKDKYIVCLTNEAITAEEFDQSIDEVINQLQALKAKGRKKLAALQKTAI